MKKAIIIHAWESNPDDHWYREEEKALSSMGYTVLVPKMPGGTWPKKEEWVNIIKELKPDEETILIGHSLGVPAILRYLEVSEKNVNKVFLIAAFAVDLGIEETRNFVSKPFNWKNISNKSEKFYVINETNDPWVPVERGKELAADLGAEFVEVDGNIHFDKMDLDLINSRLG